MSLLTELIEFGMVCGKEPFEQVTWREKEDKEEKKSSRLFCAILKDPPVCQYNRVCLEMDFITMKKQELDEKKKKKTRQ